MDQPPNLNAHFDAELLRLRDYLAQKTGMSYERGRLFQLAGRVGRRVEAVGLDGILEYFFLLQSGANGAKEFRHLIDILSIRETSFFRNQPQFDVLSEFILPAILSNKEFAKVRTVRLWSAGCSTGQEAYSLAATVHELLGDNSGWDVKIYATDISGIALERTEAGLYNKTDIKTFPKHLREKYFTEEGKRFRVSRELRKLVVVEEHNLLHRPVFSQVDIIFCRNVMIYFTVPTIRLVVDNFADTAVSNGYLFLGHSESLFGISDRFRLVDFAGLLVYKKSESEKGNGSGNGRSNKLNSIPGFVGFDKLI
jgi:chemotaxis protein methyltransferase CheR